MYSEFIPEVSIINNPINKEIFNSEEISTLDNEISKKYNLKDKKIYLWLSHDRKKKGMSLILNAWKSWENKDDNSVLLIVGAKRNITIKNVFFIGEVSSKSVIKYYKLAHVFLFPTLWKEGFGLSLSQAICAGCFNPGKLLDADADECVLIVHACHTRIRNVVHSSEDCVY